MTSQRRAKIVATLGPATADRESLTSLIAQGVDGLRLNLSHGDHRAHRKAIKRARSVARSLGREVCIFVDLMGPRFRVGELDQPVQLVEGSLVRFGASEGGIPLEDATFLASLKPGERILVDNGLIEGRVETCDSSGADIRVLNGGTADRRKGINLPDTDLPFSISAKDERDIAFATREDIDAIAVSFVGHPDDLKLVRDASKARGKGLPLIAKLERAKALDHLEDIVETADAVMVARGDLGVEIPFHQVPLVQRATIRAGRRLGRPVIVATQMLESMISNPRPTRAEASDVANAVFDGADALMLSGETAIGQFPAETVRTMSSIIEAAESEGAPPAANPEGLLVDIPNVVSAAAVHASERIRARWIVAFSQGGLTARMVARHRPETAIAVVTRDVAVARLVMILWGTTPLLTNRRAKHHSDIVRIIDDVLLGAEIAESGDPVVVLMGEPIAERPATNLMRVHRIRKGR